MLQVIQQGIRGVRSIQAHFYLPVPPRDLHRFLKKFIPLLPTTLSGQSDIGYSYCLDLETSFGFYGAVNTAQDCMFGLRL
jgi:hypothetical protein